MHECQQHRAAVVPSPVHLCAARPAKLLSTEAFARPLQGRAQKVRQGGAGCRQGIKANWEPSAPPTIAAAQAVGFDAPEVEHLLMALFEESQHMRSAIARIRAAMHT